MTNINSQNNISKKLAEQAIQDEKNQIFDQKLIQIETDTNKLVDQSSKLLQDTEKLNQDLKDLISKDNTINK